MQAALSLKASSSRQESCHKTLDCSTRHMPLHKLYNSIW